MRPAEPPSTSADAPAPGQSGFVTTPQKERRQNKSKEERAAKAARKAAKQAARRAERRAHAEQQQRPATKPAPRAPSASREPNAVERPAKSGGLADTAAVRSIARTTAAALGTNRARTIALAIVGILILAAIAWFVVFHGGSR
jgi:cobalamin biosynthesis Mg chelatase CobN